MGIGIANIVVHIRRVTKWHLCVPYQDHVDMDLL